MIDCSRCGNRVADGLRFCTECGTEVPATAYTAARDSQSEVTVVRNAPTQAPPPTERFSNSPGATAARAAAPTVPYQQHSAGNPHAAAPTVPYQQPQYSNAPPPPLGRIPIAPQPTVKPRSAAPIILLIVVGLILIVSMMALIYVVVNYPARPRSTTLTETPTGPAQPATVPVDPGRSADELAASLNSAIDGDRLVNLSGDDAYTYYLQLRAVNPEHPALINAKAKVLQKLRDQGEEIIKRKVTHSGEVSLQDWQLSARRYEWAHALEPGDQPLAARQKYAQGKLAEAEGRRPDAWQNFLAAAKLDSSWAVPQNDLGYWITQSPGAGKNRWSNAIPYYEKAISLEPNWEIPYNNLGTAYFYLENYDEAESRYRQAIERNSNWARPHKWLGDVYNARSNFSAALQEYQTALNLYNPNTDSLDTAVIQKRIAELRAQGY